MELINEYVGICTVLSAKCKELGAVTADYNHDFYPSYFAAPGSSVTAKEKEANYKCLSLLNEKITLESEIQSLHIIKQLIETIIPYAPS
jgi:hypothetical protein